MKQKTTRCPYCGEEILAVAKKCKHCGEWLDEENVEEENTEEEEESPTGKIFLWFLEKVFPYIILIAVAYFTLQSEQKQIEKAFEERRVKVRKKVKNEMRNENAFTQAIGKGLISNDDIVDELIRQTYSIKVNDYKIISTITVKDKETGESKTLGIAAFGIVLIP